MNVVLVDPIAATPNLTARALVRGQVPPLPRDAEGIAETKSIELATEIARRGHRATVLVGDRYLGREGRRVGDVQIVPVPTIMRFPFHPGLLPVTPSLVRHPALRNADVVQAGEFHQPCTFFACVAARSLGVPIVLWQETFRHMRFPGSVYQRTYESTVGRYVRASARRFVLRTTKAEGYLERIGVGGGHIGPWIPTGIDVDAFAPRTTRLAPADFGWPDDAKVLLLVARLHPTKGVDLALRTLKWIARRRPDVRLLVRGSGPELDGLRALANDLGLEDAVRFLPRQSRAAMVDLYNLAAVVLCTSRADLLPFSLMEASACGRPCVATDVGAIRDIVVDGSTGFVVRDYGVPQLGERICALLDDDALRDGLGFAARLRTMRHFALRTVVDRFLEVYRDVAA